MYILRESGDYWLGLLAVLLTTGTQALAGTAPYPHSPLIEGITWHAGTHPTDAGGSDLWLTTWAADGHIYTSCGGGVNENIAIVPRRADAVSAQNLASIAGLPYLWYVPQSCGLINDL